MQDHRALRGKCSREPFQKNIIFLIGFWIASGVGDRAAAAAVFAAADADGSGTLTNCELRSQLDKTPELRLQLQSGRDAQLQSDWGKLFDLVDEGCGDCEAASVTRDEFATMWADSGLGEAPCGLGIASPLAAKAREGDLVVPKGRGRAAPPRSAH